MKVKSILKALEGAPEDADVSFSIRAIKVVVPKGKDEDPKPAVVKKPASKAVKPLPKPDSKKPAIVSTTRKKVDAKKNGGKK